MTSRGYSAKELNAVSENDSLKLEKGRGIIQTQQCRFSRALPDCSDAKHIKLNKGSLKNYSWSN